MIYYQSNYYQFITNKLTYRRAFVFNICMLGLILRFVLERRMSEAHSYLHFITNLITGLFAKAHAHTTGVENYANPWVTLCKLGGIKYIPYTSITSTLT